MLTTKKIRTLRPRTRLRKVAELCGREGARGQLDIDYARELMDIALVSEILPGSEKPRIEGFFKLWLEEGDLRAARDIHFRLLAVLGEEPGDWDLVDSAGRLDSSKRVVKAHSLFLDRIRSPYNIGSIFRSAESFGVDRIYIREGSGDVESPRCRRTAMGALDSVPWEIVKGPGEVPGEMFALELGGEEISSFDFPEKAVCALGSEEDGLSPDTLSLCSSRVSIAMLGAKGSVNVSVAAGILLHAWSLHP